MNLFELAKAKSKYMLGMNLFEIAKARTVAQEPEQPEAPKEPIAYMYGTKQLPPLPEWDKETYPYAYIAYYSNYYYVYFSSVQLYFKTVNTLFYYLTSKSDEDGQYQRISCHKNDLSAWSDLPEKEGELGMVQIGTLHWCNVDCYKEGGTTLHLAASEPVPVYE